MYADGGVVGVNPSPYAGTWAWVAVAADGTRLAHASGLLLPPRSPCTGYAGAIAWPGTPRHPLAISNNHSEWVAAVLALEALPAGWQGHLATDSRVTMHRLLDRDYMDANVMPIPWWVRGKAAVRRLGHIERLYVKGHPSLRLLKRGATSNGYHVSSHNVYVDWLCQQEAKRYHLLVHGMPLAPA